MALAVFLAGAVLSLIASRITLDAEKADVTIGVTQRTGLDIVSIRRAIVEDFLLQNLYTLYLQGTKS
jgi:hypothetical protein